MARQRSSFPFRWVLPYAQLFVCIAVLWPERGFLLFEVSQNPFSGLIVKIGLTANPVLSYLFVPRAAPDEEQRAAVLARQWEIRKTVPVALNLPAFLVQLPYIILNPEKREWAPRGISFEVWRALSLPISGMFFWWFAGRGIEALRAAFRSVARPRIGWVETLFAGVLVAGGVVALIAALTSTPDDRRDFQSVLLVAGAFLWGALASSTVAARILQWRIAKRQVASISQQVKA